MDMQGALRARLLADGDVTALAGTRVDWVERPQSGGLPAVTLQVISDPRPHLLRDFDLRETRVQIDVWARNYAEKRQLVEAVIGAVLSPVDSNGISFRRTSVDNSRDGLETTGTARVHREIIDLIVRWTAI